MAIYEDSIPVGAALGRVTQYAGAVASLALMVGIGIWGYELVMRDVTGIPVVQAMEGEMRVAPENPGGEVASHTGLSVNEVLAEGEAGAMEDTLMLAPAGIDLAAEDIDVQPMAEAEEVVPVDPQLETADAVTAVLSALTDDPVADEPVAPLDTDDVLALVEEITAGTPPLEALPPEPEITIISRDIPGVTRSLRPFKRPAGLVIPAAVTTPPPAAAPAPAQPTISTVALPSGTKLVQLGAFPSPESAALAWDRLQANFGDYLTGKEQLIQQATAGGRTFYRLRAQGFAELADAKRLCAALEAENADCMPVVIR